MYFTSPALTLVGRPEVGTMPMPPRYSRGPWEAADAEAQNTPVVDGSDHAWITATFRIASAAQ